MYQINPVTRINPVTAAQLRLVMLAIRVVQVVVARWTTG
jgi:hypothetical protein